MLELFGGLVLGGLELEGSDQMLNRVNLLGLGIVLALSLGSGAAFGQVVEQADSDNFHDQMMSERMERLSELVAKMADGQIIRIKFSYRGYRKTSGSHGNGATFWSGSGVLDPDQIRPKEPDLPELERIEVEGDPHEVVYEYHMIDYARDLLVGKYSDQLAEVADTIREHGGDQLRRLTRTQIVEEAVGAYGMHLTEHPEDWFATREMAVALLELGRVGDAIGLMYVAYMENPELGIFPISSVLFGEHSKETMSRLVVRAVRHTNRKPSAEGWLLVGVLMQAEGRIDRAGEMIDRAEGLGLDLKIVNGLRKALP